MAHTSPPPTSILVLISGSGTNLQALIDATTSSSSPLSPCTVTHVISNKKSAYGLTRATQAHIPTTYHNLVPYKARFPAADGTPAKAASPDARLAYDTDLANLILAQAPDLVVCAGWMHILAPTFLAPLADAHIPVINLHPALPGEFNGINAIQRAWQAGREGKIRRTGVMVHYVIQEVDMGEPIVTEEVPLEDGESVEALEERMHAVEHRLIVEGTRRAVEALWKQRSAAQAS